MSQEIMRIINQPAHTVLHLAPGEPYSGPEGSLEVDLRKAGLLMGANRFSNMVILRVLPGLSECDWGQILMGWLQHHGHEELQMDVFHRLNRSVKDGHDVP